MPKKNKKPLYIVKKRRKNHQDFHGGSWKLAYADFVTAMMAFFLLLWSLNANNNADLKEVSEYFKPTLSFLDSKNTSSSTVDSSVVNIEKDDNPSNLAEIEYKTLLNIKKKLEDNKFDSVKSYKTPYGLEIILSDKGSNTIFDGTSAELTNYGRGVVNNVAKLIKFSPSMLEVTGNVCVYCYSGFNYDKWQLAVDRANIVKRVLLFEGVATEKIQTIAGTQQNVKKHENIKDAEAKKISITLLRPEYLTHFNQSAP